MKNFFTIAAVLIFSGFSAFSQPGDSLNSKVAENRKFFSIRASLSASYVIQKNFNQGDVLNFLFIGNADYFYKVSNPKFNQTYHLKTDLGFLKYLDSVWVKYSDSWRINIQFNENSSDKITHAYALNMNSQFLNTYRWVKKDEGENVEQWRGGFLIPASLNFSYNVSVSLWEYSNVMLGLSSVRVVTKPRYDGAAEPKESPFAKTKRCYVLGYYGMSGQLNIYSKKITGNVIWDNTSSFFVDGISKDRVNFDFQNKFTFKFFKYLQFRIDTHIIYDPLISYQLQYDQGFLIGVFYERKK